MHVTSQAHALSHVTLPHAPEVVQSTVHAPVPHVMLPHASIVVHSIVHANPAGHVMAPHPPGVVHSTVQVLFGTSHDVHGDGQPLAASLPLVPWTQ